MKLNRTFAAVTLAVATFLAVAAGGKEPVKLGIEGALPPFEGVTEWINSPPLTPEMLRGKVVLVNIWTYSCINSLRPLPYLRAWAEKYKDAGLMVIGVHSPEFQFETVSANVHRATVDHRIAFPVAVDSNYVVWRAFDNQYWPALYFIDAQGRVRYHRFGEGEYEQLEQVIQQLLEEAGRTGVPTGVVAPRGEGVEAAAGPTQAQSEETYLGYARARGFVSPGGAVRDGAKAYVGGALRAIDQWALAGDWIVESERAVLQRPNGRITYRFHARDLHMVLGPSADGKPVRFRVLVDGQPPLADHGTDTDAQGNGTIDAHRLYQLVRQQTNNKARSFEIEFADPGVQAYVFTFG